MLCMDDAVSIDTDNSNIWVHNLDLFYGTKADWQRLCKASGAKEEGETMVISRANVAAQLMEHLCTCSSTVTRSPGVTARLEAAA